MIGTIRKHSTWLWAIIITVVIITFVFWGSQTSRVGNGAGGGGNFGSIDGRTVTREEFSNAQREVYLRYFFSTGDWPDADNDTLMRDTYFRLFLIRRQQEAKIHVSPESVAQVASQMLRSLNRGNPVPIEAFVQEVLAKRGLTAEDFANYIAHDLGIQELAAVAGLGGALVTPAEARSLYERENTELSAQAVFFSASNYLANVAVTPEAVAEFYTNQMAAYRLPDRVQVTYVEFPASNFMAQAAEEVDQSSNLTERVEATYERLGGTNFFRDAKTPDEARETIRKQIYKDAALTLARKKAYEFATGLFAIEPAAADNLGKLAAKKGLTAGLSAPFDRQYPPSDLKVRADFNKQAFGLSSDEPYAGPIVGEDAVFVIALYKKMPSEIPPLESIKAQVTDDYKLSRAITLARQAGASFVATLAAGLPNGKTFTAICAESKVHPVLLPPFSLNTRSLPDAEEHVNLSLLKQAAFGVQPGKPTEFVPSQEGGFVLFVQSRLPLDEQKLRAELPDFTTRVRRIRQGEAFNDWFRKEAERGLRDTPALRPTPSVSSAPSSR